MDSGAFGLMLFVPVFLAVASVALALVVAVAVLVSMLARKTTTGILSALRKRRSL